MQRGWLGTRMRLGCACFLLCALVARGNDLYHIRRLSEKQLVATYTDILRDACRIGDSNWRTCGIK
jgi:hypothetical protein